MVFPLFDAILKKVCAAVTIQSCYRSYLERKYSTEEKPFIQKLIEKRARECIRDFRQNFKSWTRFKGLCKIKRAMTKFSQQSDKDSQYLYIEKNCYLHIRDIVRKSRIIDCDLSFYFNFSRLQAYF